MKTAYDLIQSDDVLETECNKFSQQCITFFQAKTRVEPLNMDYMHLAISNLKNLAHHRLDLAKNINDIIATAEALIPSIHNQQTLDHIANAFILTTQYANGKISNKEEFESRLKAECHIVMQMHQKYTIAGYTLSTAIAVGALAISCALPYVALACVLAAMIAGLTYHHTHDPHRIIGDKLFHGGFEPSAPPEKQEPDALSTLYGM